MSGDAGRHGSPRGHTADAGDTLTARAQGLEREYESKARAELATADSLVAGADLILWSGDVFAEVVLVKGDPGPAEVSGSGALGGPDGEAATKALVALGFDASSIFATVARPESEIGAEVLAERVRMQVETVDPYAIVALDPVAADVVRAAFSLGVFRPGRLHHGQGRIFLALDGLEASLADDTLKKRVWRQFRVLAPRASSL